MDEEKHPSIAQRLMRDAGLTKSRAYMFASGERVPNLHLALEIHRKAGVKLGILTNATDEQIAVLEQMQVEAA